MQNLVYLHGGIIRVDNLESGGAEFVVEIPAADQSLIGFESDYIREENLTRLDGVGILFVDDHQDTRTLIAKILSDTGAAGNGCGIGGRSDGRNSNETPDILLTDLSLPGHDGYELLRKVRALDDVSAKRFQ